MAETIRPANMMGDAKKTYNEAAVLCGSTSAHSAGGQLEHNRVGLNSLRGLYEGRLIEIRIS